jgi:hypothetical protein
MLSEAWPEHRSTIEPESSDTSIAADFSPRNLNPNEKILKGGYKQNLQNPGG